MPVHFEAAHGSAVDSENRLVIYRPRIEPGTVPDEIEYQYAIYQNDDIRDGIGIFGLNVRIEENGEIVRLFTLDLGQPQVIESIQKLQRRLAIEGDEFAFLHGLADGLVKVFQGRTDNTEAVQYVALTQEASLQAMGLSVPEGLPRLPNGQFVLAQAVIPAHPVE
ncbi:MAG: hypothetical protein ABWZ54_07490, partial [Luteibacter sp.]